MELRDVTAEDLPVVVEMNRAAMPAVSDASLEDMAWYAEHAAYFKVATDGDGLSGFLIAFTPGSSYASENYRWFDARYDGFVYVDRIVIAEDARGHGLGQRFYEDVEEFARGLATRITCEVNTRPPNEGSLRFHTRLGFEEAGTQDTEGGKKTVALLVKPLSL
jgi:hypothetical protein